MGANAQTTVPTFTTSQVLTSAQMNQSARTGVPVFAGTSERDAAFGGSGEKTLAEGQLCYLESTNVVQYYDGSVWATVGPATPGALVYITGASFTAAATVSMASGVFTSTYSNYLVTLDITATSTDQNISVRVNNAGSPRTGADYYGSKLHTGSVAAVNQTSAATSHNFGAANSTFPPVNFSIIVAQPASTTVKTNWYSFGIGYPDGGGSPIGNNLAACNYNTAEANDGLTFLVGGTITGTYRVYGIVNS